MKWINEGYFLCSESQMNKYFLERYQNIDVYFAYRNGDFVAACIEKNTPMEKLPNNIKGYWTKEIMIKYS